MKTNPAIVSKLTNQNPRRRRIPTAKSSPVFWGLLGMLLSLPAFAAASRDAVSAPRPLSETVRSSLGRIAVVSEVEPAKIGFDRSDGRRFDSAEAAVEGAGGATALGGKVAALGAKLGGAAPVPNPGHAIVALGLALEELAPLSALVGTTGAKSDVLTPAELSELEIDLAKMMERSAGSDLLRDDFLKVAKERTGRGLVVRDGVDRTPVGAVASGSLAQDGITTLLKVSLEKVELRRLAKSDDSFTLLVSARVRLMRAQDGNELCELTFEYKSGPGLFLDWTLHHAEAFQRVFQTASRRLAEKMVEVLFLEPLPSTANLAAHSAAAQTKKHFAAKSSPVSAIRVARRSSPIITFVERPALSSATLAGLGTIGIISTSTLPTMAVQRPLNRNQAMREAREDATRILDDFDSPLAMLADAPRKLVRGQRPMKSDPGFGQTVLGPITEGVVRLAVGAASSPVAIGGSLGGQAIGATRGLSAKKLQAAESAVRAAIGEVNLQDSLRAEVLRQAKVATSHAILLVKKPFPPGEEAAFSQMACVMAGTLAWVPEGQTPAYFLSSQGIDTALEIQILHPALNGTGTISPLMGLSVDVRANLIRMRDTQPLYSFSMKYQSAERKFTEWAASDAQPLRAELNQCAQVVAATIVDQLSLHALPAEAPLNLATTGR